MCDSFTVKNKTVVYEDDILQIQVGGGAIKITPLKKKKTTVEESSVSPQTSPDTPCSLPPEIAHVEEKENE